jgi:hypothetical protein
MVSITTPPNLSHTVIFMGSISMQKGVGLQVAKRTRHYH